ncbi:hypothetical protein GYMLUDRAFT_40017 [Collybiopsis luxurians FD-317 M1]|nr:hypothetical protein GYMLUDRAFT_40017 [Collybiopsis luxurians FD-317 M1]
MRDSTTSASTLAERSCELFFFCFFLVFLPSAIISTAISFNLYSSGGGSGKVTLLFSCEFCMVSGYSSASQAQATPPSVQKQSSQYTMAPTYISNNHRYNPLAIFSFANLASSYSTPHDPSSLSNNPPATPPTATHPRPVSTPYCPQWSHNAEDVGQLIHWFAIVCDSLCSMRFQGPVGRASCRGI